ncbi:MAG: cytochrome c oxidase subunit [Novosphingobium lindaniclasticum]|jgi:cytochrome c oxidase subunit 2|uniref:cytochrome c oxidase subunit II n=1 Tax=Novosphingobium lindaniclasticum TaxID=1329895 RepID=UPI00240A89FD|nr:cytochrome c oxidase subunit II [Novosphingobium lindaniclasticum]MDF2639478.1 cytochrome c oxidase subunit [Novosphingobium lindaniclasticum]
MAGGVLAVSALVLTGCNRHQSALAPFGLEARSTLGLTVVLTVGAAAIALAVAAIYVAAARAPEGRLSHKGGMRLVLWLGAIIPTVVLTALLLWALPAMRPLPAEAGDLRIRVEGEQFWWRVAYRPPGAPPLFSANEVRLPVGRTVVFELAATDVVHSFWIPGLAGKMDMIPGRTNRLVVKADKPGTYRGVCAEFCGLSHALMAFDVIAMEPAAFDAWLVAARTAPPRPQDRGAALFAREGCASCHAVADNGTRDIGPDLTGFGERLTLGAGILAPTPENTAAFIRDPHRFKPGARMPAYAHLSEDEALALARWLKRTSPEEGR